MGKTVQTFSRVAEIKLTYRNRVKPCERPQVTFSTDCYQVLKAGWDMGRIEFVEQFKVLLLNRANQVLGIYEVSTGGIAGTVADPKLIFAAALKACASGIILAHIHPSGNLKPSAADLQLTKNMKQGGEFLDIAVLDHILLTSEGYYSLVRRGSYSPFLHYPLVTYLLIRLPLDEHAPIERQSFLEADITDLRMTGSIGFVSRHCSFSTALAKG